MENDIKKDVLISVKGYHEGDDQSADPLALMTDGRLYKKLGKYYLSYKESEATGLAGTTTTLKLEEGKLSLIRTGKYPSTMIFCKGESNMAVYPTDYGPMTLVITTTDVKSTLSDDGGVIDVHYDMEIENQPASRSHLVVTATPKQ